MTHTKISRLDGELIHVASSSFGRDTLRVDDVSLGIMDGVKIIVDNDVFSRIDDYEMLASAQRLDARAWLSTKSLKEWLIEDLEDVKDAVPQHSSKVKSKESGDGGSK